MQKNSLKITISIANQRLTLYDSGHAVYQCSISTAKNGVGEEVNSECTPRGRHIIRAKIGDNCLENTVFKARRPTGEIFNEALREKYPTRDWILTRVLWLSGLEPGFNRLANVDTMRRYIYIHGCPDADKMGLANTHGCINMHNREIITFYNMVDVGTEVHIDD